MNRDLILLQLPLPPEMIRVNQTLMAFYNTLNRNHTSTLSYHMNYFTLVSNFLNDLSNLHQSYPNMDTNDLIHDPNIYMMTLRGLEYAMSDTIIMDEKIGGYLLDEMCSMLKSIAVQITNQQSIILSQEGYMDFIPFNLKLISIDYQTYSISLLEKLPGDDWCNTDTNYFIQSGSV